MSKNFPVITPTMIETAVDNGLDAIYRELQNAIYPEGEGDGGVAGMHYCSGECDDLKASLIQFMTRYVELERIYAPEHSDFPEGIGSPYSDPNYLDAARTVEAHHAYMLTMGFSLDGSNDYGLFNPKAGSPDEMVAKLSITIANVYTHTMTVEFAPGTPDVVHIDLQQIDEIQITLDDEEAEASEEGHGAFCD